MRARRAFLHVGAKCLLPVVMMVILGVSLSSQAQTVSSSIYSGQGDGHKSEQPVRQKGIHTSIGVNSLSFIHESQSSFSNPMLEVKAELGIAVDAFQDKSFVILMGLGAGKSLANRSEAIYSNALRFDLGAELPVWYLLKRDHQRLGFNMGMFGAMCSLKGSNTDRLTKWGMTMNSSLVYTYQLANGYSIGGKLFGEWGWFWGKKYENNPLDFKAIQELGVAAVLYF